MKRLIISILIAAVILSGCSATNNTANADPFGHISLYAKGKTNSI